MNDSLDAATTGPAPGFLRAFAETRAFLLGRPQRAQPTPDGKAVLFLRSPARVPQLGLFQLDVATGHAAPLVTPTELCAGGEETLSEREKARRERQRITDGGFTSFSLAPDGASVLLPFAGRLYVVDRATRRVSPLTSPDGEPPIDPRFSPDGARVAFVQGSDLWVVEVPRAGEAAAAPRPLTTGGSDTRLHGLAEFVAQEEMARHEGHWWAPNGLRIACAEVDQSPVERFGIADPARPGSAPTFFHYPRPGRDNARVGLSILDVTGARPPLAVAWDHARYPYLARVLWDTPHAPLTILVQTRDQREEALLAVDEATGATRVLLVERDEAWLNLDRDVPRWLPDGSGFLWCSERTGRRVLEKRAPDGAFERALWPAPGDSADDAGFIAVVHLGANALTAVVGDAVTNRIVRIPWASGASSPPVDLTRDRAEHAPVFCADGSVFVDTRVAADAFPETRVCTAAGDLLCVVPSAAEDPPFRPALELVTVTAADGVTTFNASIVRPRAFEPGRRYPVVVHVYGGPHALMVKADARNYLFDQWLADHGVVVVSIDNRGTPRRGRAWERAIKGDFAAAPLADQSEGLLALARTRPELDLSRVGIYGWSFGGYMSALAVMRRPDLFHVAVAGAPVVDWHDYDTHYTERYLDLPAANPEGYRASSLLTWADGLRRPLLLVHGTADDNVYFFHSLKLADALFRAGRPFDFLPLPRVTHQIGDATVRERVWERVAAYLLRHLRPESAAPTRLPG